MTRMYVAGCCMNDGNAKWDERDMNASSHGRWREAAAAEVQRYKNC